MVFPCCGRILKVRQGTQGASRVALGKSNLHSSCKGELGILSSQSRILSRKSVFLSNGNRDLGVTFKVHPGSQASSQVEAKNSALLSSCHGYLLEHTEWPKWSQASSGVLTEDSGLLSRPCRKRKASSRDYRGISWFFSSRGTSVGFLTRYDGELREPLLWRQRSQVSIRVARGSVAFLLSHGRGIRPQDALKDYRGLSRVAAGNPGFPRLVPVTSGSFSGCL